MQIKLIKFQTDWCNGCKRMQPILESLKKEYSHVEFVSYDSDENPKETSEYNVRSVPTFVIELNGEEVWRKTGLQLPEIFKNELNKYAASNLINVPSSQPELAA